jgi:hypothetical protein
MLSKTLHMTAYLVAGLEHIVTSTKAFDKADSEAMSTLENLPVTTGRDDWTKSFLVSHYFMFFLVQDLLPDNTSDLVLAAKDKLVELAKQHYNKLSAKLKAFSLSKSVVKDQHVSLSQAAEMLGISVDAVQNALEYGDLVRGDSPYQVNRLSVEEMSKDLDELEYVDTATAARLLNVQLSDVTSYVRSGELTVAGDEDLGMAQVSMSSITELLHNWSEQ